MSNKQSHQEAERTARESKQRGEKPDAKVVRDAQEAEEQIAQHEHEPGASSEDVRHGFSQDSGYAQSGGAKREPAKRSS